MLLSAQHLNKKIINLSSSINVLTRRLKMKVKWDNVRFDKIDVKLDKIIVMLDNKEVVGQQRRPRTRSALENIAEAEEPQNIPQGQIEPPAAPEIDVTGGPQPPTEADITRGQEPPIDPPVDISNVEMGPPIETDVSKRVSVQEPMDISDLPTQKLKRLSQQSQQKTGDNGSSPKRPRQLGYLSSESRQLPKKIPELFVHDQDKENVPPGVELQPVPAAKYDVGQVSTMLHAAGIADIEPPRPDAEPEVNVTQGQARRRNGSESTETQLGSLDRTKVSLGDSVNITDSQKFIRNNWGVEGTMMKIVYKIKADEWPVTVETLVDMGPVMVDYKRIIAARCFTSILKLKQFGFIRVTKNPETLEIQNITLGPRFDTLK